MQERLKQQAVERSNQRRSSSSLLTGKIFDGHGNPMTPSHANKKGVRYRYYVSHALLQGRKTEIGSIARVSAPNVETLIIGAICARRPIEASALDRDVVEQHLARATIGESAIEIDLRPIEDAPTSQGTSDTIRIPFAAPKSPRKGVAHEPKASQALGDANRIALLTAIARAKSWIETIHKDSSQSFKTIADRERLAERRSKNALSGFPDRRDQVSRISQTTHTAFRLRRLGSAHITTASDGGTDRSECHPAKIPEISKSPLETARQNLRKETRAYASAISGPGKGRRTWGLRPPVAKSPKLQDAWLGREKFNSFHRYLICLTYVFEKVKNRARKSRKTGQASP